MMGRKEDGWHIKTNTSLKHSNRRYAKSLHPRFCNPGCEALIDIYKFLLPPLPPVTCLSPWGRDLQRLQTTVSQTLHWGRGPECLWRFSSLSCLHVFWKPLKTLLLPAWQIPSAWCSQCSEPGKRRPLWAILGQRTGELGQGCAGLLLALPPQNREGTHFEKRQCRNHVENLKVSGAGPVFSLYISSWFELNHFTVSPSFLIYTMKSFIQYLFICKR